MTEPVSYQIPQEVRDVVKEPLADPDKFYEYVKKRPEDKLSVYDCTVLLAALDVVGKSIMGELRKWREREKRPLQPETLHALKKRQVCCEYLADELRAVRRGVAANKMAELMEGEISVGGFVNSVVLPMLSRIWLPAAWYQPDEEETQQKQRIHDDEHKIIKDPEKYREQFEGSLLRELRSSGSCGGGAMLNSILAVLKNSNWELAKPTASYLSAIHQVWKQTGGKLLEVPILLVERNSSEGESGHLLRALLVPFEAACTTELTRSSLLPARQAVEEHFADSYRLPELCGLVIGDYPGGVYCPGVSDPQKPVCVEAKCDLADGPSEVEGPSAGLAFGLLLASKALGLEMLPNSCATARITPEGKVEALRNKQSSEDDPSLKTKGRTIALFAHVSGSNTAQVIVGDDKNGRMLLLGVQQYLTAEKNWSFSWTCHAVNNLQEALNYSFLPEMYGNVINNLNKPGGKLKSNKLAEKAARLILDNPDVNRWVVSVPSPPNRGWSESEDFETALAQEIYRLSKTKGKTIRIPVCLSARDFYIGYYTHSSEKGILGQIVAQQGGIVPPDCRELSEAWLSQIERNLKEGVLILILSELVRLNVQAMGYLLDALRLKSNGGSNWKVKSIVAVRLVGEDKASDELLKVLRSYDFRECNLADIQMPGVNEPEALG